MDMAESPRVNNSSNINNSPSVILIDNLYTNKDSWKLARRIFRMLTSVGVIKNDILSIEVEDRKGKARVYVRNESVQTFVVNVFADVRDAMSFYDIRKVTAFPIFLRVGKGREDDPNFGLEHLTVVRDQGIEMEHPSPKPITHKAVKDEESNDTLPGSLVALGDRSRETNVDTSSSTTESEMVHPGFERLTEEDENTSTISHTQCPNIKLDASTSVSGLPPPESSISVPEDPSTSAGSPALPQKTVMVDVKTSTPQMSPCFCPETIFYHKNQHVGTETRHAEFKQGGVVFELRSFRYLLGRYLCAFLNTEGGVIYFGVTDDGRAVGIDIDQRSEDQIRIAIDNAVSSIKPTVPTSAYSINFAKIMDANGQILEGLKVLEVCVHPRYSTKTPYSYDNAVYVRRDGSLRTM